MVSVITLLTVLLCLFDTDRLDALSLSCKIIRHITVDSPARYQLSGLPRSLPRSFARLRIL